MDQNRTLNQVFVIFLSFVYQFSWNLHRMIVWNIFQVLVEAKPIEEISEASNWVQNQGFCYLLKVASLVSPDIAQDYSLRQCLTSGGTETSKKKFLVQIGVKMIFSILMSSSVHSNLFVFSVINWPTRIANISQTVIDHILTNTTLDFEIKIKIIKNDTIDRFGNTAC